MCIYTVYIEQIVVQVPLGFSHSAPGRQNESEEFFTEERQRANISEHPIKSNNKYGELIMQLYQR